MEKEQNIKSYMVYIENGRVNRPIKGERKRRGRQREKGGEEGERSGRHGGSTRDIETLILSPDCESCSWYGQYLWLWLVNVTDHTDLYLAFYEGVKSFSRYIQLLKINLLLRYVNYYFWLLVAIMRRQLQFIHPTNITLTTTDENVNLKTKWSKMAVCA